MKLFVLCGGNRRPSIFYQLKPTHVEDLILLTIVQAFGCRLWCCLAYDIANQEETNSFGQSNIKNKTKEDKLAETRSSWFFFIVKLTSLSHAIWIFHSRIQAPYSNSMDFMSSDLCDVIYMSSLSTSILNSFHVLTIIFTSIVMNVFLVIFMVIAIYPWLLVYVVKDILVMEQSVFRRILLMLIIIIRIIINNQTI